MASLYYNPCTNNRWNAGIWAEAVKKCNLLATQESPESFPSCVTDIIYLLPFGLHRHSGSGKVGPYLVPLSAGPGQPLPSPASAGGKIHQGYIRIQTMVQRPGTARRTLWVVYRGQRGGRNWQPVEDVHQGRGKHSLPSQNDWKDKNKTTSGSAVKGADVNDSPGWGSTNSSPFLRQQQ